MFNEKVILQVVLPIVAIIAAAVIYVVNVPAMQAAGDIIDAFTARTADARLEQFEDALARESFAEQEVVEQFIQQAIRVAASPEVPAEEKIRFVASAETALVKLIDDKYGDARVHVFAAGFYRSVGEYEKAAEQSALARSFSPDKPAIVVEQGIDAFRLNDIDGMSAFFKEAYDLAPANPEAQVFHAAGLIYQGQADQVYDVVEERNRIRLAQNNLVLSAAEINQAYDLMEDLLETRIEIQPEQAQHRASLAFIHYRNGDIESALSVLEEAVVAVPAFAEVGTCYIENIQAGNAPDEGC